VGIGEGECVVASDPQAIVEHTRRVVYMQDREVALVTRDGLSVHAFDGQKLDSNVELIEGDYDVANKEGFPHFMLKEIQEQPRSVRRCLRGRLDEERGNAKLGGPNMTPRDLAMIRSVVALGCGTSYHAGMVGAMAIEALARL